MSRTRKEQKRKRGRSPNRSRTREQANERASRGSGALGKLKEGIKFYKTDKGTHALEFLPYIVSQKNPSDIPVGDLWYERIYYMHNNIGPEEVAILCPAKNWGHPCPICEERWGLDKDQNASEDEIKALRPKERALYNVREGDDLFVWDVSTFLFTNDLEEELRNEDEVFDGFWDVVDRATVTVRFREKSWAGRKFFSASKIDFQKGDDLEEGVEEETQDLDALLVETSYEDIARVFLGVEEAVEEDKTEEDGSQTSTRKPRAPKEEDDLDYGKEKEKEKELETEDSPEIPKGCEVCPDCDGTGKNSRGTRKCSECRGKGHIKSEESSKDDGGDEDDDIPFDKNNDSKCPHGHTWGSDCEDKDECEECDLWDDCMNVKEAMEKEAAKK